MQVDRFSGDPRVLIGPRGWTLDYEGGQPVMDAGLENQVILSLFTRSGWCGNVFLPAASRLGSDFLDTCEMPLTLQRIRADIPQSAERALKSDLLPSVDVAVTNPQSWNLRVVATLGGRSLTLDRQGMLWNAQAGDPASGRLVKKI